MAAARWWGILRRMNRRPLIITHRAKVPAGPENSLSGILRAAAAGADIVEVDVRRSLDGVPFLHHDPVLGRTAAGFGPIRLLPAVVVGRSRLRGGDGDTVPTLAAALSVLPAGLEIGLHLKDQGALVAVLRGVEAAEAAGRTWLWLHRVDDARAALDRLPEVRITLLDAGAARRRSGRRGYFDRAAACGATAVSVPWNLVDEELTTEAHTRRLLVYSVEHDRSQLPAFIAAGLDGVITDDPAGVATSIRNAADRGDPPGRSKD